MTDERQEQLRLDHARRRALRDQARAATGQLPQVPRRIGLRDAAKAAATVATRRRVPDDVMLARVAVCETCEHAAQDPETQATYCQLCKCGFTRDAKAVFNLAAYDERRRPDGTVKIGCKHPQRGKVPGKGWSE